MKYLILLPFVAFSSVVTAATYTVANNTQGFSSNGVTNNVGELLSGIEGSAAIGTFSSDSAVRSATSAVNLLDSDWIEFGSSKTNFIKSSAPTNLQGLFESEGSEFTNYATFSNKDLYLVLGNAATLTSSDQFFIYKFTKGFGSDADIDVEYKLTHSSIVNDNILVGSIGANKNITPLAPEAAQPTFQMATLVPEPSSTALLGLGTLALMFRRRR